MDINFMQMRKPALILTVLVSMVSCGDSGSNKNNLNIPTATVKQHFRAVTLSGLVNNDKNSIKNGRVDAVDSKGTLLASFQLKDNARYKLTIPVTAFYPVVLTAYPESASSEDEQLKVAVANPAPKYFDITSLTTAIANKALAMGGYTRDNLMKAALTSVAVPDKDRTMGGFSGDPTQQFGGWH